MTTSYHLTSLGAGAGQVRINFTAADDAAAQLNGQALSTILNTGLRLEKTSANNDYSLLGTYTPAAKTTSNGTDPITAGSYVAVPASAMVQR